MPFACLHNSLFVVSRVHGGFSGIPTIPMLCSLTPRNIILYLPSFALYITLFSQALCPQIDRYTDLGYYFPAVHNILVASTVSISQGWSNCLFMLLRVVTYAYRGLGHFQTASQCLGLRVTELRREKGGGEQVIYPDEPGCIGKNAIGYSYRNTHTSVFYDYHISGLGGQSSLRLGALINATQQTVNFFQR